VLSPGVALSGHAAVLADLDGTLIDSDAVVRRAWTAFAARHGLDADEVMRIARGRPSRETALELAPAAPDEPARLEHDETTDTDGVVALPGAAELLGSRLTVAIVTSCSRRLAEVRLAATGLPIPPTMVCADEITRGKPDPEGYLLAARRLGAPPADCVVLEDAPAGIRAGRAAGMTVIALSTTHDSAELEAAGADAVVDGLTALTLAR
jgi:mannitol-1-/sugar-/sorbitol-6-phosphatase